MARKGFMLDLSDEDVAPDMRLEASFSDDLAPMQEDSDFNDLPADQGYEYTEDDRDESENIMFTHNDELPNSDLQTTIGDNDVDNSSPMPFRNRADSGNVDSLDDHYAADGADGDDEDEEIAASGAKRVKKAANPSYVRLAEVAAERSARRTMADESRSYLINDEADSLSTYPASSRKAGTFGRVGREKGSTLPAYHKKVSHELDEDDELMLRMREKGFTDKQIAERLTKEGRVRYGAKSVSTRIQRIKAVQAQYADFELENGMKEWKMGDDQLLLVAYDLASIEISYEIERLRAWRFKKTAEWMHRMNKDSSFSGKACHDRYSALMDGTATIPCDVDDDPEQRRAEMEAFRIKKEDEREAEREEKEAKAEKMQRNREEAAARKAKSNLETAERRAKSKQAAHDRANKRATKKTLEQKHAEDYLKKKRDVVFNKEAKLVAGDMARKLREDFALKNFRDITENTPDPRGDLSDKDLRMLCRDRKINDHVSKKEGNMAAVLLKRLRDADEALRVVQLRDIAKEKGIPHTGTKVQLKYQLALLAARSCESFLYESEEEGPAAEDATREVAGDEMEVDGVEFY